MSETVQLTPEQQRYIDYLLANPAKITCHHCLKRAPHLLIKFTQSPRYTEGNWCSWCGSLWPFDRLACPCCSRRCRCNSRNSPEQREKVLQARCHTRH